MLVNVCARSAIRRDKRRRQGLTAGEERLLAELVDRHDRVMVLRAEALALLHARGIDVGERVAHA